MTNEKKHFSWWSKFDCVVCGGKSIGINFGARTCAPCKAFFRRNARRKEILTMPCAFGDTTDETACTQIRYCSACRLRRCFSKGMKEESIRTEAENQRYRLLIQTNRERRRQLLIQAELSSRQSDNLCSTNVNLLLEEMDWKDINDVRQSYEAKCLKMYIQGRNYHPMLLGEHAIDIIHYHAMTTMNNMTALMSFLLTIPSIQSLPKANRRDLCQRNIRSLVLLNANELNQLCFTDASQTDSERLTMKYICGDSLYAEYLSTKVHLEQFLINDPNVTRLWLLILFLSSSLECEEDLSPPTIPYLSIFHLQQLYTTILWKYLNHRYSPVNACQIFTNLTLIFLRIQRLNQRIDQKIRTRDDLRMLHRKLCRAVTID